MSKIEKALKKARETKASTPIGSGADQSVVEHAAETRLNQPDLANGGRNMPATATGGASNLVEKTSESTATIQFMNQPVIFDTAGRQLQKIIVPEAAENATITALREIRTKILQQTGGRNCVIMITGTSLGSGVTFTSVNLAAAFALDTARTSLAIDCNIRDPSLHTLVTAEIKNGLTNFLMNNRVDLADIIQPTGIARLRVIPAGVEVDPTVEYFTMERMRRLLHSVRERYSDRNVILDCPPIARSADSQILQQLCDYVVVVVPYAGATPSALQATLKHIEPGKLLGVVINREPALPEFDWKATAMQVLRDLVAQVRRMFLSGKEWVGRYVRRSR